MAVTVQCPTMGDILAGNQCLENFAGLGSTVYVGLKEDLLEPMKLTDGVYTTPKFKSGKGLYRFDCKDDAQQIQGSSLKNNKGFELTGHFVIDAVTTQLATFVSMMVVSSLILVRRLRMNVQRLSSASSVLFAMIISTLPHQLQVAGTLSLLTRLL